MNLGNKSKGLSNFIVHNFLNQIVNIKGHNDEEIKRANEKGLKTFLQLEKKQKKILNLISFTMLTFMNEKKECFMGKMMGLWLLGVPILIIILLKIFGII